MRVAIVGAGPAGLVAALAARQAGFDVDVFERRTDFVQAGTTLGLARNGLRALDAVGVLDALRPRIAEVGRGVLIGERGKILARLDFDRESLTSGTAVVMREDLIEHLAERARAEGATLRMAETCIGFADSELHFGNGTVERADVVLGADGINSVVREQLKLDGGVRPLGWATVRAVVPLPWRREPSEIWLRGRRVLIAPMGEATTYFAAMAPLGDWDDFRNGRFDRWMSKWEIFGSDVVKVMDAVSDWTQQPFDEIREVRLKSWSKPPVFLLGDSAHAMSPDIGQGANSAMVDAVVLMRLLAQSRDDDAQIDRVAKRYESIRRGIVAQIQRSARVSARLAFVQSGVGRVLRDIAIKGQMTAPGQFIVRRIWAGYNRREEPYMTPRSVA